MKSPIEIALDKIAKGSVKSIPTESPADSKEDKKNSPEECMPCGDSKPTIYLDDEDMPSIKDYKAGDKIILVIECTVDNTSTYSRASKDKKGVEDSFSSSLKIEAIADITKG